jgi:hypothetical protein
MNKIGQVIVGISWVIAVSGVLCAAYDQSLYAILYGVMTVLFAASNTISQLTIAGLEQRRGY